MKFVFRADASVQIGTGHVRRCLTLANALKSLGHDCLFVCRDLQGGLSDLLDRDGHKVSVLPAPTEECAFDDQPSHAAWAEVGWRRDAAETAAIVKEFAPDWLIVDHYAFDGRWQRQVLEAHRSRLFVIDDLADRPHVADLLLDQNLGRSRADYAELLPTGCDLLVGPHYALLRAEFSRLRASALCERRERLAGPVRKIMISMGGVDLIDVTSFVLKGLQVSDLPDDTGLLIVMGSHAPGLASVRALAADSRFQCEILIDCKNMAELMSLADLSIGAAGSTSWERCCLGLPGIIIPIADNQLGAAGALERSGASSLFDFTAPDKDPGMFAKQVNALIRSPENLQKMSVAASAEVDGDGVSRVIAALTGESVT